MANYNIVRRTGRVGAASALAHIAKPYLKRGAKNVAKALWNKANGGNTRHTSRYAKRPKRKVISNEPKVDITGHQISVSKTTSSGTNTALSKTMKACPPTFILYNYNAFAEGSVGQQYYTDTGRTHFDYSMFNSILNGYDTGVEGRIFIEYITQTSCWTNQQNTPVEITLWDCICKKDAPTGNDCINTIAVGIGAR